MSTRQSPLNAGGEAELALRVKIAKKSGMSTEGLKGYERGVRSVMATIPKWRKV
jgi:hypothetical protein